MSYKITEKEMTDIKWTIRECVYGNTVTLGGEVSQTELESVCEKLTGHNIGSTDDGEGNIIIWGWDDDTPENDEEWRIVVSFRAH